MFEERHLIRQLNDGSRDALRAIYARYREDLYTVAVSLLADEHLAEDCLQDVFVRLAESAGRITVRTNLKAYLATALINRARDQIRRKARLVTWPVEELPLACDGPEASGQLEGDESTAAMYRAMRRLPAEQQEVFCLHAQAGMTFREIARLQCVSVRTAHSRYRYAIDKLRATLDEGDRP